MAGQPKANASKSPMRSALKSLHCTRSAVPPAARTPCATKSAMASVLPVPLQYTTATLLICISFHL